MIQEKLAMMEICIQKTADRAHDKLKQALAIHVIICFHQVFDTTFEGMETEILEKLATIKIQWTTTAEIAIERLKKATTASLVQSLDLISEIQYHHLPLSLIKKVTLLQKL
jgi:hypothetical protein